ncbi:hypothetical protein FEZ48_10810 [Marinilactibacillus psychrotolerans]|uniref:Uncharacterized protein n=1 Tax=Marinilactibacillus psychrotolerans TaxID=191770 RepID=A0A5R9C0J7_9LACT|nr:hypothetical protein [Marinilactibacillus psychrotolerans]TLQ06185.1 hypothetical protein FEZ48_10810 [Marinilactibacillus psychrotolerans]
MGFNLVSGGQFKVEAMNLEKVFDPTRIWIVADADVDVKKWTASEKDVLRGLAKAEGEHVGYSVDLTCLVDVDGYGYSVDKEAVKPTNQGTKLTVKVLDTNYAHVSKENVRVLLKKEDVIRNDAYKINDSFVPMFILVVNRLGFTKTDQAAAFQKMSAHVNDQIQDVANITYKIDYNDESEKAKQLPESAQKRYRERLKKQLAKAKQRLQLLEQ